MKKAKILIADDFAVCRAGLRMLINGQRDMRVVGEAVDGNEAVRTPGLRSPHPSRGHRHRLGPRPWRPVGRGPDRLRPARLQRPRGDRPRPGTGSAPAGDPHVRHRRRRQARRSDEGGRRRLHPQGQPLPPRPRHPAGDGGRGGGSPPAGSGAGTARGREAGRRGVAEEGGALSADCRRPRRGSGSSMRRGAPPTPIGGWRRCSAPPWKTCSPAPCSTSWLRRAVRRRRGNWSFDAADWKSSTSSASAAGTARRCGRSSPPTRWSTAPGASWARWPWSPTSPSAGSWRANSSSHRRWRPWDAWPVASRTISTTSSA